MRGKNYLVVADSGLAYKVQAVGPADSLDALQGLVGSWSGHNALIELVETMHTVEGTIDCWANEEGQFRKGFQTNIVASALCKKEIKGPVIFTGSTKDGETIPVPEEFIMGAVEAGVELEANGKQYTWPEVCIELMEQEQKFLEYLEMEERHND
jgi:hypothetical protein